MQTVKVDDLGCRPVETPVWSADRRIQQFGVQTINTTIGSGKPQRLLVHWLPVQQLPVRRLSVHRVPVHRLPVPRLPVNRLQACMFTSSLCACNVLPPKQFGCAHGLTSNLKFLFRELSAQFSIGMSAPVTC